MKRLSFSLPALGLDSHFKSKFGFKQSQISITGRSGDSRLGVGPGSELDSDLEVTFQVQDDGYSLTRTRIAGPSH